MTPVDGIDAEFVPAEPPGSLGQVAARAACAGAGVGAVDSALHTMLRFTVSRRLYGMAVTDLPHARGLLTGAFVDLLAADALSRLAARSLDRVPQAAPLYCASACYLVPRLLSRAMGDLATVLGARFYLRDGPEALFGEHFRGMDLLRAQCGHPARSLELIGVELRVVAGAGNAVAETLDGLVGSQDRSGGPPFDHLAATASSADVTAALALAAGWVTAEGACSAHLAGIHGMLDEMGEERRRLVGGRRSPVGESECERYGHLLAATACVGVWRDAQRADAPFLSDLAWLHAALLRLQRAPGEGDSALPDDVSVPLLTEMTSRLEEGHSFDINRSVLGAEALEFTRGS